MSADDFDSSLRDEMSFVPEELRPEAVPDVRLVGTWLSQKPKIWAFPAALFASLLLVILHFLAWTPGIHWAEFMTASRTMVFEKHEFYRLFTAPFLHADPGHLLSNSFLFFILSYFLMAYFGWFLFPVLGFFMAALIHGTTLWFYPAQVELLGASGLVYWMGGVWLSLYLMIDRRRSFFHRWLRAVGVGLLLFVPSEAFDPKVSYLAHAVGFFYGTLTGFVYFKWNEAKIQAAETYRISVSRLGV